MARYEWSLALPALTVGALVGQLAKGFDDLASSKEADFSFDLREPDITKRLVVHLQTMAAIDSNSGFWDFEVPQDTADLKDPRRVDIRWATIVDNKIPIKLVFECKKLSLPSDRHHAALLRGYRRDGILRFVGGSYAPKSSIGFMVVYAQDTAASAMQSVRRALGAGSWSVTLQMLAYEGGVQYRKPAKDLGQPVDFETRHARTHDGFPDITLYHMALTFQDPNFDETTQQGK